MVRTLSEWPSVSGVRGDLLQWARLQQGLTMRWIRDRGGPSPAYQSEVEHGIKSEVRSEMLSAWVRALHVTVPFARGHITPFHLDPAACRGLAAHIREAVAVDRPTELDWPAMSPDQRARGVLQMISRKPTPLPQVVLAYVMGLELDTLEAVTLGTHPVMEGHLIALVEITTLSPNFFAFGELESPRDTEVVWRFLPALRLAQKAGITPEEIRELALSRLRQP